MSKMLLDFQFDQITGESRIVIDFHDETMTALEINEAIRSGEIREQVVEMAETILGEDIARRVRLGEIRLVCLDHEPELGPGPDSAIPLENPVDSRKKIGQ